MYWTISNLTIVGDLWFDETKEMVKRVLRTGLGVIFFFAFLGFLLVGALKFRVLSPIFWKTALDKGGVYQQLQGQVERTLSQSRESVKQQGGPAGMSKEMLRLLYIDKELTADRFRELIETNLDRFLSYMNGKSKELVLYLPVKEWDLPVAALGQSALANLTSQTPVEEVLPLLGMKQDQIKVTVEGLGQVKSVLGYLTMVSIGLLLLVVGTGVGHYFLGVGLADRIGGTAWLLLISGFLAKLIGVGAGNIFELIATNSKPPVEPWMAELGRSLVGQFFNLGATIGLVAGIVGLVTIVVVKYLTKKGKIKEEKDKMGFVKRTLSFVLGVTLGFVVLGGVLAGTVMIFGGKVEFKAGGVSTQEGQEETQRLSDDVYVSEKGWEIKFPEGWEVIKDEKSEGVIKRPVGSVTNWATIEIGTNERTKEVDAGTYLVMMKQGLSSATGFKNAAFAEEPFEEVSDETGWKRFVFMVDYDGVISQRTMRLRLYSLQYFPAKSGDGFVIMARVPVESWPKYEKILKESVDTFWMGK